MSNGNSRTFLWIVIGGGVFFVFLLAVFALVYYSVRHSETSTEVVRSGSGGTIAVVDLEGVIVTPKDTVKQLKKFADDDSVKAIILHINSPGGGVAASEEIYKEVRRIRDDEEEAGYRFHRNRRRQRCVLRRFGSQQNLFRQRQHRRFHRRDHGMVQLRRPHEVG